MRTANQLYFNKKGENINSLKKNVCVAQCGYVGLNTNVVITQIFF